MSKELLTELGRSSRKAAEWVPVAAALWGPGIVALTLGDKLQFLDRPVQEFLRPLSRPLSTEEAGIAAAVVLALAVASWGTVFAVMRESRYTRR